eukprot:2613766-Amphidinium_carterae.1
MLPALGSRVQVSYDKQVLPGAVAFVGPTSFATGDWIGVTLDNAVGKNDGCVKGVRYFQCEDLHGIFVRWKSIVKIESEAAEIEAATPAAVDASGPAAIG